MMFFLREALGGRRVDLGHDQRHVRVHAPGRGIVDDEAAPGADPRRTFLRRRAAGRHEADVGIGKVVVLERLALERPLAERDLRSDRAGEASATTSETGKRRSARIESISRPTLPVAPATATLKPDIEEFLYVPSISPPSRPP